MKPFYPACSACGLPTDGQRFCDVSCEFDYAKAKRSTLVKGILADLARLNEMNKATLDEYLKATTEQAQIVRTHADNLTNRNN